MLTSNFISEFPETAKKPILFHRDRAKRSVAACLSFIIMVSPYSKLMAAHTLFTPVDERFIEEKTTKTSNYLNDLINHNAYLGKTSPFFLNSNTTELIFAMNHENEQVEKMAEHSEESEGAGAQQPQPLMEIPLPPMNHAQITAIIHELNTGIDEDILNTMLSYVPLAPPNESLTILSMLQQLIKTHHIVVDFVQLEMLAILTKIHNTESFVDMTKPKDQQCLAVLILSYYTAINSPPPGGHFFFGSFLLHAIGLSGIEVIKDDILGEKEPIENHGCLKANVKEANSVFSGLKLLGEMRLNFAAIESTLKS
ncbi:hypothetical protein [Endozoicomonas sp. ALD040]|uniref:hypothetical protein n=1 Tax=Endozoicomonas sp. ALD040 TaxID=3403079 RepID=UPI003BB0E17F